MKKAKFLLALFAMIWYCKVNARPVSAWDGLAGGSPCGIRVPDCSPKNSTVPVTAAATDLDSDNDGITDCVEKRLQGATMSSLFHLAGTAVSGVSEVQSNTVRLTDATANQAGSAWSKNKINFAKSFTIRFDAYLGTNNANGADGIATVFHNDPAGKAAIGINGLGLGAAGIKYGIALELDTYQNGTSSKDIAADHGMIWDTDAANVTTSTNDFVPEIGNLSPAVSLGELENGNWHKVVITWDAATRTLTYTVNGIAAGRYTHAGNLNDFCETYFNIPAASINKLVYYGYTASTGGFNNTQSVRILDPCADFPQFVDTDGDGIEDYLDLDSDGDGCPDAVEGSGNITSAQLNPDGSINSSEDSNGIPILANGGQLGGTAYDPNVNSCAEICTEPVAGETFEWDLPKGTPSPVTRTFTQPPTTYGFALDLYKLDNSFNMTINGVKLAVSEIEFQSLETPAPGINVRFLDGTLYETGTATIWSMTGTATNPLIRIMIYPDGSIGLFGSKTSGGSLFPLELFNGNALNTVPWNTNANNTIVVTQNVVGQTQMNGYGYGQNIVPCACYEPAYTPGTGPETKMGVTLLQRAGSRNSDHWPMVRKSGHVALESNSQGFVITRMNTADIITKIANPKEGMMVYDTDAKCLKIHSDGAWKCFSKPACP